jgi:hypothetical protein
MTWTIIVEPSESGRTWNVVGVATADDGTQTRELLEGGFFARLAADNSREEWERDCRQAEVETAERKAGWDPNP